MSQCIEPRSPRSELDERQRKKARPATPINVEQIGCLIDIGVSNFYQCEHQLAEASFSLALSKIDGMNILIEHVPSSIGQNTNLSSQELTLKLDSPTDAIVASQANSPLPSPPKTHKLQDYDEGMNVFRQPVYPHDDINSVTVTLFYNIGLTHTSRGQYEDARLWFVRSLTTRQTCLDFGRVKMDAMILHNIGHCIYSSGNKADALKFFEHALLIILLEGPGTRDEAATLNCIGVIKFHNGACEAAMEMLQRSLDIYRAQLEKDLVETATLLNNIGRVHFTQDRCQKGLVAYQEALSIREKFSEARPLMLLQRCTILP
jgi:tetratricopeptide (TPR) repeat protein